MREQYDYNNLFSIINRTHRLFGGDAFNTGAPSGARF